MVGALIVLISLFSFVQSYMPVAGGAGTPLFCPDEKPRLVKIISDVQLGQNLEYYEWYFENCEGVNNGK